MAATTTSPDVRTQPKGSGRRASPPSTVLVTGSSGLIGSRLCDRLARTFTVIGFDRDPPRPAPRGMRFVECDLTRDDSVRAAISEVRERVERVASVVHLAAHYDFSGAPSPLYDELTVRGTRRLLLGLQDLSVEQFVFSSTLLVMKPAEPGHRIDETSAVESTWEYPRSKLDTEALIEREHGSIPAVILRIAGVYDEETHSIPLAQQFRRIREKQLESYFFPGNPDRGQPFVHMDDLLDAVELAIEARGRLAGHEVFLIAEPDIVTYAELQDVIGEELHGREWPTIRIPAPLAKVGAWLKEKLPGEDFIKPWMVDLADAHYPVSIERARRRLGWEPRHRLREELAGMVRRMREDPARWYATNHIEPPDDLRTDRAARAAGA
jgi:dihydroflavonol-4-reductase